MKQFVLCPPSQMIEVYVEMKPVLTWIYNEKKKNNNKFFSTL